MEKPEARGAARGLRRESSGGATRGLPGGNKEAESGAVMPSGVVLFQGSGPSLTPGAVIRSPGSSRPPGGVVVLGPGPNQHLGGVASHSLGSGPYPDGFKTPGPGTNISGALSPLSKGAGVYSLACNPNSGITCPNSYNAYEDRPRSILKNNSSIMMQKSPSVEKLQDTEEDMSPQSSHVVTPEVLAKRFTKMDNFCPKILQYGVNRSPESPEKMSKPRELRDSSDFEKHRKAHYDEGKFLKALKGPALAAMDDDSPAGSVSSGYRSAQQDSEPRAAERGRAGGLARGFKDETDLVARNHILEAKDASTTANPSPAVTSPALTQDPQRKEYYSKGRYLRSCSHPELDEPSNSFSSLTWETQTVGNTEVRVLGHKRRLFQDNQTSEKSLKIRVTPVRLDTTLPSKDKEAQLVSGWCQWLVSEGLSWQSPAGLDQGSGSCQSPPNWKQPRYETAPRQGGQEKETKPWEM
ncbi:uncharacterized protein LOC142459342 isoform X2 [Tenrec ecaudatus]|uniref:uncharacterized protein LOC142459342 isoform X2 n=1 Tax=Tenrec ecaudatus TaxID=94439 RepID=UPI003F5AB1EF